MAHDVEISATLLLAILHAAREPKAEANNDQHNHFFSLSTHTFKIMETSF
jgi:hypothetical protein